MKNYITKKIIGLSILAGISFLFSCQQRSIEENKKPNILFIFADDQRYGTMGAAEIDSVHTPNLDRLAQSGVYFNNCYIAGASHGAVCSPSRAMLMTGKHYWNLPASVQSMWDKEIPPETLGRCDYITMPELLKQNGYYNITTGKHHNGPYWVEDGFDEAKAVFLGGMTKHFGMKVKDYNPQKGWSEPYTDERFSSELFSEQIVDFIDNYDGDQPFFAYLPFTSPHDPRTAPQKFHNKYKADEMVLPDNFMPEHPFPIGDMQIRDEHLAGFPRTKEEVKKHIADYYAMIEANDYYIGNVLQALEKSDKMDNTIIMFSSDNGLAVGQHGLLGKQNVYEHSIKVPLIIACPGIKQGEKSDALIYLHDIFPTICEITDIGIPESVETKSFKKLLSSPADNIRTSMHFAYSSWRFAKVDRKPAHRGHHRAVRKGDYKLILSLYEGVVTEQLFKLKDDPFEKNNLANDQAYNDIRQQLLTELESLISETGDYVEMGQPDWGMPWGAAK